MVVEIVEDTEVLEKEVFVVKSLAEMAISSQADYTFATNALKEIKAKMKTVEAHFEPAVEAAHKAHKAALAARDSILKPMKEAEALLKRKAASWFNEQERARKAEALRIAEEQRAMEELLGEDVPSVQIEVVPEVEKNGMSFVEVWKFEIVDPAALPREYLMPDDSKIGQVVRALKSGAVIPGVRVYSEKSTRVR